MSTDPNTGFAGNAVQKRACYRPDELDATSKEKSVKENIRPMPQYAINLWLHLFSLEQNRRNGPLLILTSGEI